MIPGEIDMTYSMMELDKLLKEDKDFIKFLKEGQPMPEETANPAVEKVTQFKCCLCNTMYKTLEEAKECFKKHVTATGIADITFNKGKAYPASVTILFEDGELQRYVRE